MSAAGPPRHLVVDFDHLEHRSLAGSDEAWREVRQTHEVAWTEANGGYWIAAGYEAVTTVLRDWETFSSARTDPNLSVLSIPHPPMPRLLPEELDPPEWNPIRRVLAGLLSPGAVEHLRPRVRHWVHHHIDAFIERGSADLAHELALLVPVSVTMEWLGWPEHEWVEAAAVFHEMARHEYLSPPFLEAGMRFLWLADRIHDEVAARRAEPRDDVMSIIATCDLDGRPITAEEAEGVILLLIGGGVDTTTSLASAAFVHLGRDTDLRDRLRRQPELLREATEEFLRYYPPARTHGRTVTRDVELGGCPLRAGDRILVSEASACRDAAEFPDADTFIADRLPNRHAAFGVGIHRCVGSNLARLEFAELVTAVLDRLGDYRLGTPIEYPNWAAIGGWAEIPVTFGPGPRVAP